MAEANYYELYVVRQAPITDPEEYTEAIDALVSELLATDPTKYYLFGYSPAHRRVPCIDGETSNVPKFVGCSEIEWNHGRDEEDPTHEVVFFNEHEDENQVYLKIAFLVVPPDDPGAPPKPNDDPPKCPGIVAELRLGTAAASPPPIGEEMSRGQHLDNLFGMLITTFQPDYGHVELPSHPPLEGSTPSQSWPMKHDVGWVTFLSRKKLPVPPALAEPAMVVPYEEGNKLFATSILDDQTYPDLAPQIDTVREALRPRPIESIPAAKPPSVPPTRIQRPSFMKDPVTGLPIDPAPTSQPPRSGSQIPPAPVPPPMMASVGKRETFDYDAPPEHVAMPFVSTKPSEPPPAVSGLPFPAPVILPAPENAKPDMTPQFTQELPAIPAELLSGETPDPADLKKLTGVPFAPQHPKDPKKGDKK